MDPRTGQSSLQLEHQRIIQMLIDAGLLCRVQEGTNSTIELFENFGSSNPGIPLPAKFDLSIEWGYEVHSVEVTPRQWARILGGNPLDLESEGAYEGEFFDIAWFFNQGERHELYVEYGDDGAVGYEGSIFDLGICEIAK